MTLPNLSAMGIITWSRRTWYRDDSCTGENEFSRSRSHDDHKVKREFALKFPDGGTSRLLHRRPSIYLFLDQLNTSCPFLICNCVRARCRPDMLHLTLKRSVTHPYLTPRKIFRQTMTSSPGFWSTSSVRCQIRNSAFIRSRSSLSDRPSSRTRYWPSSKRCVSRIGQNAEEKTVVKGNLQPAMQRLQEYAYYLNPS